MNVRIEKYKDGQLRMAYFRNGFKDMWQEKIRLKLATKFNHYNLNLLSGDQHRFPHQQEIASLIYLSKRNKPSERWWSIFLDHQEARGFGVEILHGFALILQRSKIDGNGLH